MTLFFCVFVIWTLQVTYVWASTSMFSVWTLQIT